MLITAALTLAVGFSGPQPPLHCPATLEEITGAPAIKMEYGGAMYGTCCGGCDTPFMKDPKTLIAKAAKANKTVGAFEYDAITGNRIEPAKAVAFSDYKAIRYYFTSDAEKKSFDSAPTKYVDDVKSEAYYCPLMKFALDQRDSGGYADYKGVRYYLCCSTCTKSFRDNPAKYAETAKKAIKPLAVVTVK